MEMAGSAKRPNSVKTMGAPVQERASKVRLVVIISGGLRCRLCSNLIQPSTKGVPPKWRLGKQRSIIFSVRSSLLLSRELLMTLDHRVSKEEVVGNVVYAGCVDL